MKKKKEKIIILGLILIMIVAVVGVSYAAFSYTGTGTKVNSITSGAITMTYEESDNVINMTGALPTTDATGTVRLTEGEYFDFTISSNITGNVNINYEISAKDVTTSDRKIDGSNIKLYLTKVNSDGSEEALMVPETYSEESTSNNYTGRPSGEMSLYTSSMNSSETNNYRLRMYVTEEYNPQGGGGGLEFSVKINVYGKDGDKMPVTTGPVADVLLSGVGENGAINTTDPDQTFITGTDPNNYIWYSGKLWRAVSIDPGNNSVKLVTQWNISAIIYSSGSTAFEGSYMEEWLNDTSVDGFLGNLRDYENFIKLDSVWNATMDDTDLGSITKPAETTMVTDAVGLLNMYEYQMSYSGTFSSNGYLNNGLDWWSITPYSSSYVRYGYHGGGASYNSPSSYSGGVRPSINLKSSVRIVDGDGTINNPYRLSGDNEKDLSGTLLNTRYSGEYIRFGTGENNLYRIVSHENDSGTKIVSFEPLKSGGTFVTSSFGSNTTFSSTNRIGTFLNNGYLNTGNGYLTAEDIAMIEDNTTWYLGTVKNWDSYKLAKYTNTTDNILTISVTTAKVGLLRMGELMAGQFDRYGNNTYYWTLTPYSSSNVRIVIGSGYANRDSYLSSSVGVRPSINLKSNVIITGGDGTKERPFTLALAS